MEVENRKKILSAFEEYVLVEGKRPHSVFLFCRNLELREKDFYDLFPDFDGLEGAIWSDWGSETLEALSKDESVHQYSARERYLAFLFTFLEALKEHRSWVILRFPDLPKALGCRQFADLRNVFSEFADRLEIQLPVEELTSRFAPSNWRSKILLPHFFSVIDFFKKDASPGFERTEAYIEKSVRAAFEIVDGGALDAGLDLFRFLAGQNRH